MKRSVYLLIGVAMLIVAIGFIFFALNNPQASFPWSNSISYGIYVIYTIIMIACFIVFFHKK